MAQERGIEWVTEQVMDILAHHSDAYGDPMEVVKGLAGANGYRDGDVLIQLIKLAGGK